MQKISSFLWFDKEAREAAKFYSTIFKNSKTGSIEEWDDTPSGSIDIIPIELFGHSFTLMSAGPTFKPTPAISYFVTCPTIEETERIWNALSTDGEVMMEFQEYPFSKKYGWCNDKFGVSWQVSVGEEGMEGEGKITPSLLFVGDVVGKASEAIDLYTKIFKNSKVKMKVPYGKDGHDKEDYLMYSLFELEGQEFSAMDSSMDHKFTFTEGNSFVVDCDGQEEVDYFWEALIKDGGEESQCGWLKDKFGVSWQIVPRQLNELMGDPDREKANRVMQCMLKMQKIIVADLQKAYNGE